MFSFSYDLEVKKKLLFSNDNFRANRIGTILNLRLVTPCTEHYNDNELTKILHCFPFWEFSILSCTDKLTSSNIFSLKNKRTDSQCLGSMTTVPRQISNFRFPFASKQSCAHSGEVWQVLTWPRIKFTVAKVKRWSPCSPRDTLREHIITVVMFL